MRIATNPDTGKQVAFIGEEWVPVEKTASNDKGEKAFLIGGEWITDSETPKEAPKTTTEKPKVGTGEFLFESAKRGVGNFAAIPGMIADVVRNQGLGQPAWQQELEKRGKIRPQTEIEKGGVSGMIRSGIDQLLGGDRTMQPPNNLARYAGKAVEFGVTGGPFSAANIARSVHKVPATLAELGSSIGGGVGTEAGGDLGSSFGGETGKAIGEVVGGLGGGLAGMVTPNLAERLYHLVAPNLSKQAREAAIRKIAGKELGGALSADPRTPSNISETGATIRSLSDLGAGDLKPTIGQATGAQGVISTELDIARRTPEDLSKYSSRVAENEAVLNRAKNIAFPEGGSITRGAESVVRSSIKSLDDRLNNINKAQENLGAQISGMPQQDAGNKLKFLREAAQATARKARDERVQDLYRTADRMKIKEDMTDVLDFVKKTGGDDTTVFQTMPPVFGKVLREYGGKETKELTGRSIPPDLMAEMGVGKTPEASFKELHSLYRETNSQFSAAQRTGDMNAQYYLMGLNEVIRDKLRKYEDKGFGELSAKFSDFNKWFSTKYAPAFYDGVGGRMNAKGRYGDIIKPEDVTSKFFTPSGIDDFNMITSQLPDKAMRAEASQTLKDGVVGLFREKVIKDGVIDVVAAKNFLRANEETLNKVPDIKRILQDPVMTSDALADRAARLLKAQKDLDNSLVGKIAKSENPDSVIQKALTSRKEMMALIASARTDSSRKAVSRAIADGVKSAAEKEGIEPLEFIMKNEQELKPAISRLGPKHWENLRLIASGETIIGRTAPPRTSEQMKIVGEIEQKTGSTPRTIWSQSANTAAGRQSPVSMWLHLLTRFGIKKAEEKVTDVLREVIYHPELAQGLVDASRKPASKAAFNKLQDQLLNVGIRVTATPTAKQETTTQTVPSEIPQQSEAAPEQTPLEMPKFPEQPPPIETVTSRRYLEEQKRKATK